MTIPFFSRITAFALAFAGTAHAVQVNLQYEWSPSPEGPFLPIPPERLRVFGDGSAAVDAEGPQGFFRLRIGDGEGGSSPGFPVRTARTLPASLAQLANDFIAAVAADGSEEAASWQGARISPFYIPLTSAHNLSGEPDLAELKVVGDRPRAREGAVLPTPEAAEGAVDRGYLLVSLTRENPPIVGYAVDGATPGESLLRACGPASAPARIRRFGPVCLVAETEDMEPLANDGLFPVLVDDESYRNHTRKVSYTVDSEVPPLRPPDPVPPARVLGVPDYRSLVASYEGSPWLRERREQRKRLIEFEWQALEGNAPTLAVQAGETRTFFPGEVFSSLNVDDEEAENLVRVVLPGGGGVRVTAVAPGAVRITLTKADGIPQRFMVTIKAADGTPNGETGVFTTSKMWAAGSIESQPRFSQRADLERWCDAVGCAPVMLALMIAWAERYQNVPSAYYERNTDASLATRRASLREIDSPLVYVSGVNDTRMRRWYDFLHEECNVACWADGSGSTMPWDAGSTLIDYANWVFSPFFPVSVGDTTAPLVGGSAHWEADVVSDDWDESGIRTANAIKNGRPGGVLYMEHWHYCVAYRYRRTTTEIKANGTLISKYVQRFFRVNTGWGTHPDNRDRVWNAYDIDGCFLLNLYQKRALPNP